MPTSLPAAALRSKDRPSGGSGPKKEMRLMRLIPIRQPTRSASEPTRKHLSVHWPPGMSRTYHPVAEELVFVPARPPAAALVPDDAGRHSADGTPWPHAVSGQLRAVRKASRRVAHR